MLGGINPVAAPFLSFSVPEPTGVVGVVAPDEPSCSAWWPSWPPRWRRATRWWLRSPRPARSPGLDLGEILGVSDVPGGVVNLLSGRRAELAPALASHRDLNAVVDVSGDAELGAEIDRLAADSVTRVRHAARLRAMKRPSPMRSAVSRRCWSSRRPGIRWARDQGPRCAGSLVFLLVAPGVAAGLVPWLLTGWSVDDDSFAWLALQMLGALLIVAGAAVLLHAFARFVVEGWAPRRRWRPRSSSWSAASTASCATPCTWGGVDHHRPGLVLGRPVLLAYAALFMAVVATFVHLYEEPARSPASATTTPLPPRRAGVASAPVPLAQARNPSPAGPNAR